MWVVVTRCSAWGISWVSVEEKEPCQSRSVYQMQQTNVPPMPWVRSGTGEPLHPEHLPAWHLQPQNLLFELSAPGLFSSASIFGKSSITLPHLRYWGQPSREGAQQGLPGCQELARGDDPRAGTACSPPESRSSSSTHGASRHQHTDLSGLVGGLSAAIKLCQNGKASLYKSRSKPSIFYDGGHSLI